MTSVVFTTPIGGCGEAAIGSMGTTTAFGWWWIAGGAWYFYPAPVYPYPDPHVPPVAVITPPEQPAGQGLPPQPKYWYHWTSPNGYYPYVASCQGGWQAVPATPGQSPVAGATPPAK